MASSLATQSAEAVADDAPRRAAHLGGNRGEWAVVAFGAGVALYFALPAEPSPWLLAPVAVAGLAVALSRRLPLAALLGLAVLLGVARAGWHSAAVEAPRLSETARTYTVTGWIEDIERGSRGLRWVVRVDSLSRRGDPPVRVRVNVGEREGRAGEAYRLRARLRALPGPVLPGGYDSARAAYYRQLGGSGVLFGEPVPVALDTPGWEALERAQARWRYGIAERVRSRAPPATAGLQASLLTGVRAWTPPAQTEALRDAGLAHIVAISGLHMAAFAGTSYWLLSLLFCLGRSGHARDMRKPAAAAAIVSASVYLLLSGASVSAQRAYIMIVIWLAAIILEREPFSLRSVAVAALVTLALHPEALLSAGFQMSFAAVTALIVVYAWWNERREFLPRSRLRRAWDWFAGSAFTSLIAGTATAGFAVLHFGRVAKYGLAANILAMPVFAVGVMPMALLSLVAMPLGLEAVPLWLMGQALLAVLAIAGWVAGWPGAVATVAGSPPWALAVFGALFVAVMLGRRGVRTAGLVATAGLAVTAFRGAEPALRVSDRGQVSVWSSGEVHALSARADGFGRSLFAERMAVPVPQIADIEAIAACDVQGCRWTSGGVRVAVVRHPADVGEACGNADLVVLPERSATVVARRRCGAKLVDGRSLRATGALDVYVSPELRVVRAKGEERAERRWGRREW